MKFVLLLAARAALLLVSAFSDGKLPLAKIHC